MPKPLQKLCPRLGMLVLALALSLLLAACKENSEEAPTPVQPKPAPEVAVVTVQPRRAVLTTELPGRTTAHLVAEIRPQVSGIIKKRAFEEGADVKSGELLYQIDTVPFQATCDNQEAGLAKAEASLAAIQAKADRYTALLSSQTISKQDHDDIMASLEQAKADVQYWKAAVHTARINLGYARVTSPISGRIGKSEVNVGAMVTAYQAQPLTTVQELDPIYVDVTQSSAELLQLKRALSQGLINADAELQGTVKLVLEDGTPYPLEGTLKFQDVTVEPPTGTVTLRILFPNPDIVLLPGMYVRAILQQGVDENAILVPQQGVSRDSKGNPVALVLDQNGTVQQRMLTLDRALGDEWLVATGLAPGDQLIVEGMQKVRAGGQAKAVPFGNTSGDQQGVAAESK